MNIYFCFIEYAKTFDCVDHNKLENSERDENTRPPDTPPEKSVCRSRGKSSNWTWKNRLVPKKLKLESRLLGEISVTSDRQMTPTLWQKAKKN